MKRQEMIEGLLRVANRLDEFDQVDDADFVTGVAQRLAQDYSYSNPEMAFMGDQGVAGMEDNDWRMEQGFMGEDNLVDNDFDQIDQMMGRISELSSKPTLTPQEDQELQALVAEAKALMSGEDTGSEPVDPNNPFAGE